MALLSMKRQNPMTDSIPMNYPGAVAWLTAAAAADAGLTTATRKLDELVTRQRTVEAIQRELALGLDRERATTRLDAAVQALLEDRPGPAPSDRLRADLQQTMDELAVLREAIHRQRQLVGRERSRVSETLCRRIRPVITGLLREKHALLQRVGALDEQERTLFEAVGGADLFLGAGLRRMPVPGLGSLSDEYSDLRRWLAEVEAFQLLTA